jgi:hypothetical protein
VPHRRALPNRAPPRPPAEPQATPKDRRATLVVHAKCDGVMALMLRHLGVELPPFVRRDAVVVVQRVARRPEDFDQGGISGGGGKALGYGRQQQRWQHREGKADGDEEEEEERKLERQLEHQHLDGTRTDSGGGASSGEAAGWGFEVEIFSVHGRGCPLPMVRAAELAFEGAPGLLPARLEVAAGLPLVVRRWVGAAGAGRVVVTLRLELGDEADDDKRAPQVCVMWAVLRGVQEAVASSPESMQLAAVRASLAAPGAVRLHDGRRPPARLPLCR